MLESSIKKTLNKVNLKDRYYDKAGILVSVENEYGYMTTGTRNTLVLGEPGCGKTSCIAINEVISAIKAGDSIFVNDNSKEEIYLSTINMAKSYGYKVICIDLIDFKGDEFNFLELPLKRYKENDMAKCGELISTIAETLNAPLYSKKSDPFWIKSAETFIKGLCYYFLESNFNEELINLPTLAYYCIEENANDVVNTFYETENLVLSKLLLKGIFSSAERTTASILCSAFAATQPFIINNSLIEMIQKSTFNIEDIPNEKTIIYLKYPEYSNQYDSLISLFIMELIDVLYTYSRNNNGTLNKPFHFIIDEFANFRLPNFEKYISTCRSRNIRFTLLLQTIDQLLINNEESTANTIMDCCQNIISFSTSNYNTITRMSKLSGFKDSSQSLPKISINELLNLKQFEAFCYINNKAYINSFLPHFL